MLYLFYQEEMLSHSLISGWNTASPYLLTFPCFASHLVIALKSSIGVLEWDMINYLPTATWESFLVRSKKVY